MDSLDRPQDLLITVVQELSLARTVNRVTELVRSAARQLASADGATFVLRDDDKCHYVDEDAIAPLWKGLRFPMNICVSGWAMINGRSVVISDIYKDFRVPIAAYRPTFVKSLMMVPIRQMDPIGAIGVYWSFERSPSVEEQRSLEALANATSVALQNLQLHEDLSRKVEELQRAAEVKDQFLLTLSHELRTPMNAILGWSSILREEPGVLSPEMREGLDAIHRNAVTEMRLIADLLDSTQCLTGRMRLVKEEIDLNDVVRAAVQSVRVQLAKKNVALTVRESSTVAHLKGDADRLFQVVANLLSNAAKFTPAGGEIVVSVDDEGQNYLLAVEDDGEGIAPELLPKVFDRFQTQSDHMSRHHGGLGLGLAIVKSLVEAHGGSVVATSPGVGRGARFEVRLPHAVEVGVPLPLMALS